MNVQQAQENKSTLAKGLLVFGIILVAFNLRPAITAIGPIISMIEEDLLLSHSVAGLLTSLPLIVFAIFSPVVPIIGQKLSNESALVVGLFSLIIGILLRSLASIAFLFIGTLLIGVGIAISNVLLPVIVKEKFPEKFALLTSVYTTSMGLIAAVASGLSVPLAVNLQLGWKLTLVLWSIPALLAVIVWIILANNRRKNEASKKNEEKSALASVGVSSNVWKSSVAWFVAAFMGLQSVLFYVTVAWLPTILQDQGISANTAGWLLSFTQFIGLPASFIVPVIAGKKHAQKWVVMTMTSMAIIGFSILLMGGSFPLLVLAIILIGITLAGSFSLALTFIGMRARDAKQASALSGMAQSIGYLLAAVGPILIGFLYDLTDAWTVPLLTLMGITILVMIFGVGASRDRYV
ncbi:CynX/NimT family MFS transporter [Bacillus kwashiorkori]|uniref:CynX/NimT family MFS transporter n=1 Tax=Bacillus kwashiorkori TaxID=1522318 RepID=UPI00078616AF|nr:MFS transporter [Bacillus kwashiorkori]